MIQFESKIGSTAAVGGIHILIFLRKGSVHQSIPILKALHIQYRFTTIYCVAIYINFYSYNDKQGQKWRYLGPFQ